MVVNSLYYGSSAYRDSITTPKAVTSGISISDDIIAAALRNIYSRDYADNDIEPEMFRAISHSLNEATDIGIGQADFDPDEAFTNALRHSNEVFAAFKVHRAQNDMAARLLDSNGSLKPFEQWRDEVLPIASHQCGSWLRTEYDTAVLRAHQAADWQQFQAEKDVLPNLKWMPSTSANPGADHMPFWGTILPIDHPFWDQHRPGDRWNCKCALTSTDESPTSVPASSAGGNEPQSGLKDNPGKSQAVFSQDHPYFPKDCNHCTFYNPTIKARLLHAFTARVKDCYNCPYINGCIDRASELQRVREIVADKRKDVLDSGELAIQRELQDFDNLATDKILLAKKPLRRLLNHCQTEREIDAAKYLWSHINELVYERLSPMGEGKDLSLEEVQRNIRKKRERGVICYNVYHIEFRGVLYTVKLEVHENGFEQPYFIIEQ